MILCSSSWVARPCTGKTTLARLLAARIGAVHLRVDTIEQAIVRSGVAGRPVGPVGYAVGYALAEEHLRQRLTVIAESVNPLSVTRDAWRDTAVRAGCVSSRWRWCARIRRSTGAA